jgi:hypothetical protein
VLHGKRSSNPVLGNNSLKLCQTFGKFGVKASFLLAHRAGRPTMIIPQATALFPARDVAAKDLI